MGKPRVIISSDIGGSDPDDMESMAHALISADKLDIQGIISTPTKNDGRASDIYKALDAYAKDYNNLKTWGDYPTPSELKSVVHQGNTNVPGPAGYSNPTEGSKAIIKAAHAGSDPLYILTWGAMTDVAQALHDDPSIADKIRILSSNGWNGTQDPHSRDYIYNNFKDVWWIESKSTHRGIYVNASGNEGNSFKMSEAKDHGALGDYFFNARPWGVKMGDSWSIAYLLDKADNNNPGADSWGGTFAKTGHGPNFWTDDKSAANKIGSYDGAKHVRDHQSDIYNDMYKQFDKAKAPNPNSTPTQPDQPSKPIDKDNSVIAKDDAAPKPGSSNGGSNDHAPAPKPGNDSGHTVVAKDDWYTMDAGKKLYFNTSHILLNDKGADGGLKATVAAKSANGVTLDKWDDGTIVYKASTASGTDKISYVLTDKDGSTDTGSILVTIKNGVASPADPTPPKSATSPQHDPSAPNHGNVVANNDSYKVDSGKTLYFNTRFVTGNDKGSDLNVVSVDAVSERGVKISWGAEGTDKDGTLVYRAQSDFHGVDKINYKVMDKHGGHDIGTILVHVNDWS